MGYMIVKEDRIIIKPHKGAGIEVLGVLVCIAFAVIRIDRKNTGGKI